MNINSLFPSVAAHKTAAADNTSKTGTSSAVATANSLTGGDFMTLLVAQLKAQDPTSPQDPTQFVQQLVQFNSLQQLININQDLTTATPPKGGGSGSQQSPFASNHSTPAIH